MSKAYKKFVPSIYLYQGRAVHSLRHVRKRVSEENNESINAEAYRLERGVSNRSVIVFSSFTF